jgi:hypothetical protein
MNDGGGLKDAAAGRSSKYLRFIGPGTEVEAHNRSALTAIFRHAGRTSKSRGSNGPGSIHETSG